MRKFISSLFERRKLWGLYLKRKHGNASVLTGRDAVNFERAMAENANRKVPAADYARAIEAFKNIGMVVTKEDFEITNEDATNQHQGKQNENN